MTSTTASARRAYRGPVLFGYGFRPFFLFGALWAALAVPLWIWSYLQGGPAAFTRDWHVHEMLFGFLAAIVAGFLTTAVPNWTGRMPVIGAPLGALVGLWAAGRLAMLFSALLGPVAAVVDCAFLAVFAAVIWREVLVGRNWRNLPVCGLVSVLALANIAFHLAPAFPVAMIVGQRMALGAIALLIALIGGRVTPSFTRNWLAKQKPGPLPATADRRDDAVLLLTAVAAAAWIVAPQMPVSGGLLVLAGFATLWRLGRWRGPRTLSAPLVWVLHLGYGWLGVALVLLGLSLLAPAAVPPSAGIHALTAGAVGVMTLAMMTRASLGHSGRPLAADGATTAIYLAVNIAAVLRVAAGFLPAWQPPLLAVSALAWSLAFGGFALAYGPMLLGVPPRAKRLAQGA